MSRRALTPIGPFAPLVAAATLLVLLTVVATLQYRWLGQVSDAERERLRTSLRTRASDFSEDFDREVTRTFLAFHFDGDTFDTDPAGALADAYQRAQAQSTVGGIVKSVYLVGSTGQSAAGLEQLDVSTRRLEAADWPDAFASLRHRAGQAHIVLNAPGALTLPPGFGEDAIDAGAPALVVPIAFVRRVQDRTSITFAPESGAASRAVILWLDADRLTRQLIEMLVVRHFGAAAASEYFVNVVSRDNPSRVVYASSKDAVLTPQTADVAAGLFELRLDEVSRLPGLTTPAATAPSTPPGSALKERFAITIVARAGRGDAQRLLMAGGASQGASQGAWEVLVRGKSGPLEAVVARSRHRNLATSVGVLALLAGSFELVIVSARRQRRLARQQMEFVAAVSHELRTPLAVIRSAGENLADGLVEDGEQVRRYGSLIQTEGRRLSDMVERVMDFAGIGSGAPVRTRSDIGVARLVAEAVGGVEADARERGVTLAVRVGGPLPAIVGDPDSLRAAVQNILGNAVKYSAGGTVVEVDAEAVAGAVRISVADRGIGIDADDLPHLFKPFYRGRRAVEAQIRGSGVGLSVVRHVVDAHHGGIRVEPRTGGGTVVSVTLPSAPAGPQSVEAAANT